MGYFSNAIEAESYQAEWCIRCIHFEEGKTASECAVWFAHLLYAYQLANDDHNPLDVLIPQENGRNLQCKMFLPRTLVFPNPSPLLAADGPEVHLLDTTMELHEGIAACGLEVSDKTIVTFEPRRVRLCSGCTKAALERIGDERQLKGEAS